MPNAAEQAQNQKIEQLLDAGATPGPGDKATDMLSEIFGNGWYEILWSGENLEGGASLIMPILSWFNAVMIVAVALILFYVVGHAMVGSAHEGTPLGRRLHSIWVPVRSVLSISLLAPIPWQGALNFMQGVVLCFVGFSINFANMATNAAVDYLIDNHGQVTAAAPSGLSDNGAKIARVGLHNYLVQYHQAWFQDESLESGYQKEVVNKDGVEYNHILNRPGPTRSRQIRYIFKNPEPFSKDAMGMISLQCKDFNSDLCMARQEALETLLYQMEDVAARKIEILHGNDQTIPHEREVAWMIEDYAKSVTEAIERRIDRRNPELQQELEAFGESVKDQGFIMLGSYFWTMSRFSMALQDQINEEVAVKDYNLKLIAQQIDPHFNQILTNIGSLDSYFRGVQHSREIAGMGSGSIQAGEEADGLWAKIWGAMSKPFVGATNMFIGSISSRDPVSSLSSWGHWMMGASIGAMASGVAIFSAIGGGGEALESIPLVGGILGGAAKGIANGTGGHIIAALLLLVTAPLFLLGFTLAYYLPAVPFIIWSIAIFGWILLVVEACIAAPIWAAMHALPDGEGIAGDRAQQGYAIFAQILLRPVLMVIGFMIALLLVHVAGFFGEMFTVFFQGMTGNETFAGPITMIAGLFIGSVLIVIIVHKAFHLIFILPDRIPEWIGAQGGSRLGEDRDTRESRQAIVGGASIATPSGKGRVKNKGGRESSWRGEGGSPDAGSNKQSGSQAEDLQPGIMPSKE